jgi:hypothetical protein
MASKVASTVKTNVTSHLLIIVPCILAGGLSTWFWPTGDRIESNVAAFVLNYSCNCNYSSCNYAVIIG